MRPSILRRRPFSSPHSISTSRFRRCSRRGAAAARSCSFPKPSVATRPLSGAYWRQSLSRGCISPSSPFSIWRKRRSGKVWRRRSSREVITAGEQLQITPQIARLFAGGRRRLQNQYGPSESHVVTAFTLTGPPEEWPTLPPIGRPISNARIYLLDASGQPVPVGVPASCTSAAPVWRAATGTGRT